LSDRWQSMDDDFSEQRIVPPEWGSPALPISRARCIAVILSAAETLIGKRGGPGLHARVQSILDNARECKVSPTAYEVAYFISRTIKPEHVIIDRGVSR
jgi:hypothetical protein